MNVPFLEANGKISVRSARSLFNVECGGGVIDFFWFMYVGAKTAAVNSGCGLYRLTDAQLNIPMQLAFMANDPHGFMHSTI